MAKNDAVLDKDAPLPDLSQGNTEQHKNISLPPVPRAQPVTGSTRAILIGGIVILTLGAVSASVKKKPETPVIAGSIGFILLASLLDTLGGSWSKMAVGLVGLAVVTSLLVEGPDLFTAIQNTRAHVDTGTEVGGGGQPGAGTTLPPRATPANPGGAPLSVR